MMDASIPDPVGRSSAFRALLDAMLSGTGSKALVEGYRRHIDTALPEDLVAVVDAAIADGVGLDALKPAVSKLINLLSTSLSRHRHVPAEGDLLFAGLMAENARIRTLLEEGKPLAREFNELFTLPAQAETGKRLETLAGRLLDLMRRLAVVDVHYKKMENAVFPRFESRYPQFRCVRLLWALHDDARGGLRELTSMFSGGVPLDPAVFKARLPRFNSLLGKLYFDLSAIAFREECALFPVMAEHLPPAESEDLFKEAGGSGFGGRTGSLNADALASLFSAIPLDMTFVDSSDKVAWFTDSPHRIFDRSPAIIGRDVRNCHPAGSVGRVVAILDSFRRGEKDSEAFWLDLGGRFIHIEYFALRTPQGVYLGTLECSQDLTAKRGLSGERRL